MSMSHVKIYYGPCESFNTVAHKPQKLRGLVGKLILFDKHSLGLLWSSGLCQLTGCILILYQFKGLATNALDKDLSTIMFMRF